MSYKMTTRQVNSIIKFKRFRLFLGVAKRDLIVSTENKIGDYPPAFGDEIKKIKRIFAPNKRKKKSD